MSEVKQDGGPAFPQAKVTVLAEDGATHEACSLEHGGMSLHDHYAGLAMQACLQGHIAHYGHESHWPISELAGHAFDVADAMLKARSV